MEVIKTDHERNDLKESQPDRFATMMDAYEQFAIENRVQELPQGYDQRRQMVVKFLRDRLGPPLIVAILLLLILAPFVVYLKTRRVES